MARMGRPLKYNNCLDLDMDCEMYFDSCKYEVDEWGDITDTLRDEPLPYTITGLAIALHTTRELLINYAGKDDYSNTIKRHKNRIEQNYEYSLRQRGNAGDIFGLKNFGWSDRTEHEITGKDGAPIKIQVSHTGEDD